MNEKHTVLDGGTLQNAPGGSIVCPMINVNGLLKGSGTVGTINLGDGGRLAPGDGTGTLGADDTTFGPGGVFELQINDFAGTAGDASLGWDLLSVTGTLTLTATADDPLVIDLVSLTAAQTPGPAMGLLGLGFYGRRRRREGRRLRLRTALRSRKRLSHKLGMSALWRVQLPEFLDVTKH